MLSFKEKILTQNYVSDIHKIMYLSDSKMEFAENVQLLT